jgi:diacylglycerol kinase family enzyme
VAAAMRAFHRTLADLAPQPWTISIDGTQMCDEFLLVEVLNIRSVGPNLVFAPDASPSDGYFDVVTAQETHRKELETYFEHRLNGRDTRLARPQHRARRVSIASCTEMHIDDERVDTCALGPVSVEIAPAAITVLL